MNGPCRRKERRYLENRGACAARPWWQQGFRWHTRGEIGDATLAEAAAALVRAAK
jgi:hypothetical protein